MVVLRCPSCAHRFERTPYTVETCPACGLRASLAPKEAGPAPSVGVRGKPRHALAVFVLSLLTGLGYWAYAVFRIPRELDQQHGREHHWVRWAFSLIPVVGVIWFIPYVCRELWNRHDYRRARALRLGIGPAWFLLWSLLGLGAFVGYLAFVATRADFPAVHALRDVGNLAQPFWDALTARPWWEYVAAAAATIVPPSIGLALLAGSTNELWRRIYAEERAPWPWTLRAASSSASGNDASDAPVA